MQYHSLYTFFLASDVCSVIAMISYSLDILVEHCQDLVTRTLTNTETSNYCNSRAMLQVAKIILKSILHLLYRVNLGRRKLCFEVFSVE
jgi:hypothetical protein